MDDARHAVADLVERFARNLATYRSQGYNETQVRLEFINPFFEALGWDMANKAGYAEAYKDVVHEDALKVGAGTRAPDYCFRVGGARKFFLEAKKPAVDVKGDVGPAYQLRRYAWSAKLPLSLLTDFEEFAVYDCRQRPKPNDPAATARILYVRFTEYAERFGEIAEVFSRESVLRGSFDKFAEAATGKRGTQEVDAAFLAEIEGWREALARNLALRNPKLSVRELNFAVQATIDRVLFLRMCEDRGIEPYAQLQALRHGANTYQQLFALFRLADDKYNSGLFDFKADALTPTLAVDDKVLKDLVARLYYPESPYEFSVLGANTLGNVYEQFLGKVIRLTAGHQAKVEEKPEVKKAGGVYYTPTYIVDYIVRNTVGKLCEGKTPRQVAKLRVLDPACGSGSFLLGAYQYLLDWHRDWYVADGPQKHTQEVYQVGAPSGFAASDPCQLGWQVKKTGRAKGRGEGKEESPLSPPISFTCQTSWQGSGWRLTTREKKRLLLNNLYGVDIDSQAVEVTKLSLLLKVLEGENQDSLQRQLTLWRERALPDLGDNIKCGNSLIGPDFYAQGTLALDDEEAYRVNAFDWDAEFPEIMKAGGFDAVIGNPPYILLQGEFRDDRQTNYFRSAFSVASYKVDTYHLFMERGITIAKPGGRFSVITPANFLTNNYLAALRRFILENSAVEHVVVIDGGVFHGISVDNAILVTIAGPCVTRTFSVVHAHPEGDALCQDSTTAVSPVSALAGEHVLFTGRHEKSHRVLWDRVYGESEKLGEIAYVNFGKQLRDRKQFTEDVVAVASVGQLASPYVPCYTGRDVSRYHLPWAGLACLDDDTARRGGCWDAARQNAKSKLVTRQIGRYPEFAIDELGYQCLNTVFMVSLRRTSPDSRFLLGVLNSALLKAIWLDRYYDQRRTFPKIKGTYLKELPVCAVDFSDPTDVARHDRMVQLVERMLDLHKRLAAANTPNEKDRLQRQADATDQQIDQLVYELYGLTDEEIGIVEGPR
jgi:hypothetical protein